MTTHTIERILPDGDDLVTVGAYKDEGDAFLVHCEATISDSGERYYLIDSWIFRIFIPTVPKLKALAIIDSDSKERHWVWMKDLEKHKIGEDGYRWKILPKPMSEKDKNKPAEVQKDVFAFLD